MRFEGKYDRLKGALLRLVRLRRRARIMDGDDVLSEILDQPGPTDTLFDVLAACIAVVTPASKGQGRSSQTRIAILGFAGGGLVAPLRAMHMHQTLHGVDLSLEGEEIFRKLSKDWAGRVTVQKADAAAWLRRKRQPFDVIIEDLSIPRTRQREGCKPDMSLNSLPRLMRDHLTPRGVVITNMLPVPTMNWQNAILGATKPFPQARVVHLDDYLNRILISGRHLLPARDLSFRIRAQLALIGSLQTERISVRTRKP